MDTEKEIKPGSIVRLKSGSPDLKVISLIEKAVTVEWLGEDNTTQHCIFPSTSLQGISALPSHAAP